VPAENAARERSKRHGRLREVTDGQARQRRLWAMARRTGQGQRSSRSCGHDVVRGHPSLRRIACRRPASALSCRRRMLPLTAVATLAQPPRLPRSRIVGDGAGMSAEAARR
jgi:hypothetical protein